MNHITESIKMVNEKNVTLKNISVKQYAALIGVNKTAIIYRLANNVALPGVHKYEKIGNSFVLSFDEKTDVFEAKKEFRKK